MVGAQPLQIRSEINITPLVDVVLVLLIIFMVITPLMQAGYDVVNPKAERSSIGPEDQIIVAVIRKGSVFLNREELAPSSLEARLSAILKDRRVRTVFFSANDDLLYGEAISIIARIRGAGATSIGIAPSPSDLGLK